MKTEHNLLWVLDQNRGNLRLVVVVAEDGIKWRNGKTDNIDNGRSKVKVVHTHATHSYVLSMNYRTTKHIYIHKHREENEENKVLQDLIILLENCLYYVGGEPIFPPQLL